MMKDVIYIPQKLYDKVTACLIWIEFPSKVLLTRDFKRKTNKNWKQNYCSVSDVMTRITSMVCHYTNHES